MQVISDKIRAAANPLARLIKKIYEVDPLVCPRCKDSMRIIAFLEDYKVLGKILEYLDIDEFKRDRPPPKRLAVADSFDDFVQEHKVLVILLKEQSGILMIQYRINRCKSYLFSGRIGFQI